MGNDASVEAVLGYLQAPHPPAMIDVLCPGPETVNAEYGLDAAQMFWFDHYADRLSSMPWSLLRVPSWILDVPRVSGRVRRHGALTIVPGAGVLEASLPLRPWNTPYGLFLLAAWGRLFRTKIALVCVRAGPIGKHATRTFSNWAAQLASDRSYRDGGSREAMPRCVRNAGDSVFTDLAFSLPTPGVDTDRRDEWPTIGAGIMAYTRSNDAGDRATDLNRCYADGMKGLVDEAHTVRLCTGDTDESDDRRRTILVAVCDKRPDVDPNLGRNRSGYDLPRGSWNRWSFSEWSLRPGSTISSPRSHRPSQRSLLATPIHITH
jgi:polysaccharide pyruvyl transferase WcaK-like protein